MRRTFTLALLILLGGSCESHRPTSSTSERITDAGAFTHRYARSRLARWNVRAHAAGADCGVLFVETAIVMEDSMVEALHYGGGSYDVYQGGVQQFWHDRAFRGVAYKDSTGHLWTFGNVSDAETSALAVCR